MVMERAQSNRDLSRWVLASSDLGAPREAWGARRLGRSALKLST
jgi:hypothetical protein